MAKNIEIYANEDENNYFRIIPYMAPELTIKKCKYSKEADIYSLGVLLWELSSGRRPFINEAHNFEFIFKIHGGLREENISGTPPDYFDLYTACWNGNPEERPTIKVVYDKLKNMIILTNNTNIEGDLINPTNNTNIEGDLIDLTNNIDIEGDFL